MKRFIKPPLGILKYLIRNSFKNQKSLNKKFLDFNEKKIFDNLKKNGYSIIENFISKNDCEEIIEHIDKTITDYPNLIWKDRFNSDKRILGAEIINSHFLNFFENKMVHKIGEIYCGFQLKNTMTMANKVVFRENNLGSGNGWHRDAYRKQFKSILYLNTVKEENGPFQFIKNSNTLFNILKTSLKLNKNFRNTRYSEDEIKEISNKNDIISLEANSGSLILFDTTLIHRGKPLKNKKRYALTNYYEASINYEDAMSSINPHFPSKLKFINK